MLRLAVANLTQNKTRFLLSVGGVGLAFTLVLFFSAIFTGAQSRLTVYIDHAGADLWVSQSDVRTMHMSQSSLPASVTDEVRSVPGVAEAVPILYTSDILEANGNESVAYVFGVPPDAPLGQPWNVVEGASTLGPGEIIIDHAIAQQMGVGVGDTVKAIGQQFKIAGLTSGTSSIVSAVSFVRFEDFAQERGGGNVVSFVLVKVSASESPGAVSERIAGSIDGVTVQTKAQFASNERKLVKDMSADIIGIINTAGYVTGLAVVALMVYIGTVSRRREYGVLKAMGVRNLRLFQVVATQALLTVGLGFGAGLGITLLLGVLIPRFNELMVLSVSTRSLVQLAAVSVVLGGIASLLPARQLASLEPAAILRKG